MNRLAKYIFAFAALGWTASSCVEEVHTVGEPDMEGCYGVYFPAQEASGAHTYDPTMSKEVVITVAREKSEDDIEVPFELIAADDVYTADKILFEDGQKETTVKVTFPEIETGREYAFSIKISDPQFASAYKNTATSFDFSVICVEWKKFFGEGATDATSAGHIYEVAWEEDYDADMYYYDTAWEGIRYCYIENAWRPDAEDPSSFLNYVFYWNTKTNALYVPHQWIGVTLDDGREVYTGAACDFYNAYNGWGMVPGEEYFGWAVNWHTKNGFLQPHYDGNGGFYLGDWLYLCTGGVPDGEGYQFGGSGEAEMDLFLAAGFTRVDYAISASAGLTEDGVVPVGFKTGADVASVKYTAYEGSLTKTQTAAKVEEIASGNETNAKVLDMEAKTAGLTMPATGVYTLVAVGFDDKGQAQESTSVEFTFVATADEEANAVILTAGIGSAASHRDANTDNTVEVFAYGDAVTEAKLAVFSKADLTVSAEGCIAKLMKTKSLSAETIEAINGDGFTTLVSGLLPGTEYYTVVWATNGYTQKVFISVMGESTTGEPLSIYKNFTFNSYDEAFAPASQDVFVKKWNLYATDMMGKLGMREYVGTAEIIDSETPDEGPDDHGLYDEYVVVKGLAGPYAAKAGFDDAVEFDLYGGCLYGSSKVTVDEKTNVYTISMVNGKGYNGQYATYFIPVLDGYYALVSSSDTYDTYDFRGYMFVAEAPICAYIDYLLVDPAKDDNGLAPEPSAVQNSAALALAVNKAKLNLAKAAFVPAGDNKVIAYRDFVKTDRVHEPSSVEFKASAVSEVNAEKKLKRISRKMEF